MTTKTPKAAAPKAAKAPKAAAPKAAAKKPAAPKPAAAPKAAKPAKAAPAAKPAKAPKAAPVPDPAPVAAAPAPAPKAAPAPVQAASEVEQPITPPAPAPVSATSPAADILPFTLPQNLVLMAGAGAGKTHALITLALHLLTGAREGNAEPLAPARLCALTFTEKAAAEMKSRLRRRVAKLADGASIEKEEPDLVASFKRLGKPLPDVAFFAKVLEDVPLAFVGTFHSYCAQTLRRHPSQAGVSPDFELLDEGEATGRLERAVEATLFDSLEVGGARGDMARMVIRSLGFAGEIEGARGAREYLVRMVQKLSEEGKKPAQLELGLPTDSSLKEQYESQRVAALNAISLCEPFKDEPKLAPAFVAMGRIKLLLSAKAVLEPEALEEAASQIKLNLGPRTAKEPQKLAKESLTSLRDTLAEALEAPLTRAFVHILTEVQGRYAAMKQREGVLDFSDLLNRTRTLLADHPDARADIQMRVGSLLVDEFQDTNPLQLELVALLAEERQFAPRPLLPDQRAFDVLPLEPRFLVAVGDRKQSIYEFRGAEVSLISALAKRLAEKKEGGVAYLRNNWRSRPALLEFFNHLFPRVLGKNDKDFEVRYEPAGDDLLAVRHDSFDAPCAELITLERPPEMSTDDLRWKEACAIADRLVELLSDDAPAIVYDPSLKAFRAPRGGDVTLLLRRFTHLELFRRALITRSVPFVVVQGRGFFGSQEVRDLAHLLRILDEPDDAIAWAAVLRSPLVGLTDASLLRLALAGGKDGLAALADEHWTIPGEMAPFEQAALKRFREVYNRLARDADRLHPSGCLTEAMAALDLKAVLAAGFQGEQQVANLDKLVHWVRGRETQGASGPGLIARELLEKAEGDVKEGQAAAVEEGDPRAVRIMTVHQSKGLEFPIVVVPECGAGLPMERDRVLYERTLGLSVRPRDTRGRGLSTPRGHDLGSQLSARVQAESLRLFYVALTRARDYLILSGEGRKGMPSWRAQLDVFRDIEVNPGRLLGVRDGKTIVRKERAGSGPRVAATEAEQGRVAGAVERSQAPTPLAGRRWILPVSQVTDAAVCARRFHLLHELGLAEQPALPPRGPPALPLPRRPGVDAVARGTLAHALLLRSRWSEVREGKLESFDEVLAQEGQPATRAARDVVTDVRAFLDGKLAGQLVALPAPAIRFALPFGLGMPLQDGQPAVALQGQLDLVALLDEKRALVLDFQLAAAPPRAGHAEALRLGVLLRAARSLLGPDVEVEAGVVYLRDRTGEPSAIPALSQARLDADVGQVAQSVQEARREARWPGIEATLCRAAGCGYLYRCHPGEAGPRKG